MREFGILTFDLESQILIKINNIKGEDMKTVILNLKGIRWQRKYF